MSSEAGSSPLEDLQRLLEHNLPPQYFSVLELGKNATGLASEAAFLISVSALALASTVLLAFTVATIINSRSADSSGNKRSKSANGANKKASVNGASTGEAAATGNGKVGPKPANNVEESNRNTPAPVTPIKAREPPSTPASAGSIGSPASTPGSVASVLHSGPLRKPSLLSAPVNTVELFREDERNIALVYATFSGASNSATASPRSAKTKGTLYLSAESYVESKGNMGFRVHQLKSGGKKLQLEARTPEEKEIWMTKIQDAINSLSQQKRGKHF